MMILTREHSQSADATSLDRAAALARNGFACMFSTADEYEQALIAARRAEGRYTVPSKLPTLVFIACTAMLAGFWLVVI